MKQALALLLLGIGFSAAATPCFYAGTYSGKGMGQDQAGNQYTYDVKTVLTDSNTGTSHYSWTNGSVDFSFQANSGKLLISGQDVGATIQCDMSTETLHIPAGTNGIQLDETWTLTGNYLLRKGTKVTGKTTIEYQELLIRQ